MRDQRKVDERSRGQAREGWTAEKYRYKSLSEQNHPFPSTEDSRFGLLLDELGVRDSLLLALSLEQRLAHGDLVFLRV